MATIQVIITVVEAVQVRYALCLGAQSSMKILLAVLQSKMGS